MTAQKEMKQLKEPGPVEWVMENCNPDTGVGVQEYHKWKASLEYIILFEKKKKRKEKK